MCQHNTKFTGSWSFPPKLYSWPEDLVQEMCSSSKQHLRTPQLKRHWFVWTLDSNKKFNAVTERIIHLFFCFQWKKNYQRPASLPRPPVQAQAPRAVSGCGTHGDSLSCTWHGGKRQHSPCHLVSYLSSITSDMAVLREVLPALRATLGAVNQLFTEQRQTKWLSLCLCSICQSLGC